MKKFFVTLFILIILGGVVFYFGWAQLSVPVGSYGVVQSKTHGADSQLIRNGEFRWIWYKLIPANVVITVLSPQPVRRSFNISNSLPSGKSYAEFAGINADFSWELKASYTYGLESGRISSIVLGNNIKNQEDLDMYTEDLNRKIEECILRHPAFTDSARLEDAVSGGLSASIEREVSLQFSQIRDFSIIINSSKFPDFALYRQARMLYEEYLGRQREYASEVFTRMAENLVNSRIQFEELERYGQLLEKYPILLEYLAMQMGNK
jgi:hypothetical protein